MIRQFRRVSAARYGRVITFPDRECTSNLLIYLMIPFICPVYVRRRPRYFKYTLSTREPDTGTFFPRSFQDGEAAPVARLD